MSYYDNTSAFGGYLAQNPGQVDTWAYVDAYLNEAGLGGLTRWAQDLIVEYGATLTDDAFAQRIRATNEYKTRFKAIEIAKQNGYNVTESEVIANEKAYQQIAQQAGLPKEFYDSPEDYANLIGRGVSPSEYQSRVIDGFTAVRNNPGVQSQLQTLYDAGASEGDLAAFFLDPERATTLIEKRQSAATIAARGVASGFGQLSLSQAEGLAGQGVTDAQANQGFAQLAQRRGLMDNLASEEGSIGADTALAATFSNDAGANDQLERRRQERQSRFSSGGGFAQGNQGNLGVGSARR